MNMLEIYNSTPKHFAPSLIGRAGGESVFLLLFLLLFSACTGTTKSGSSTADTIHLAAAPTFVADSAMAYVVAQCDFGARVPGSAAHDACGDWIVSQFQRFGAEVSELRTSLKGYDGKAMPCRNIQARLNPDAADRILITAHWDSRAWADNDRNAANHHTPVLAANDGASGVAVMLEMARLISTKGLNYGVDFVCFDLEDQGTPQWADDSSDEGDEDTGFWCLGSKYWAEQAFAVGYHARYAINLDMVGGRDSRFLMEGFSRHYGQTLVNMIWHLAEQLGYGAYFPLRNTGYVTDDHVPINRIAGIPAIDIIPHFEDLFSSSFGPTWHTVNDTPENIDLEVMRAVGQTLLQLIYNDNE